jgi:hypothetical protein
MSMPMIHEEFTEGIGRMAEQECQRTRREMGLPVQPSKATLFIGCANEPCREKCPFKGAC